MPHSHKSSHHRTHDTQDVVSLLMQGDFFSAAYADDQTRIDTLAILTSALKEACGNNRELMGTLIARASCAVIQ